MRNGDHVVAGGCLFTRTPLALVREILRQRRTGLTLSRNLMCTEGELMMAAGAVERVVTAWTGATGAPLATFNALLAQNNLKPIVGPATAVAAPACPKTS